MPISTVIFACPAFSVPLSIVKVRLVLSGKPCNLATTASDVASTDFLFSFISMNNLLLRSTSEFNWSHLTKRLVNSLGIVEDQIFCQVEMKQRHVMDDIQVV